MGRGVRHFTATVFNVFRTERHPDHPCAGYDVSCVLLAACFSATAGWCLLLSNYVRI